MDELRALLHRVDTKKFGAGDLSAHPPRVEVDMACSIVTARVEELERDPDGCRLETLSVVESSRLQVVIAALEYFALEHDVIPDSRPTGHVDDMTIVHWAIGMVQRQLPVQPQSAPPADQP
ncbi:YkvA family protein [Luteipulveratus halotolerans]|uniref:Uncharacterized protein n=1 Tax=Luteipulveratus halotolerans TaxID=1631356 RepID=A0A0L6CHF6_9MICO|nr:hypothetical protein [Luteipulveratus halotolerans]KNX37020.1 hypothetical protein VV01_07450 [Luteipulveratus halotolerans]